MQCSGQNEEEQELCICCGCVGEEYLSCEIEKSGVKKQCSYCGEVKQAWTIEELSNAIEVAFEHHFIRTSDQPNSWQELMLADRESEYNWYRDGEPVRDVIVNTANISEDAANDVLEILADKHYDHHLAKIGEETEFDGDSHYEQRGASDEIWQSEWNNFEQSLKSEARFFSRAATDYLASIFDGIDECKTRDDCPVVVNAGPQTEFEFLYRARVFQSREKLEEGLCHPDLHLGPPPGRFATSGRMNARGISVFYGATDADTALAEVRPPVGSDVVIAKFFILRPLRLLDLSALERVDAEGSFFDPHYKERLERAEFLRSLERRITKPVMPDDQDFDYLVTQAIADFLATENKPQLDGIIFKSVQSKCGRNIVLFHKAARVEEIVYPEGTEIKADSGHWTEEGGGQDYNVTVLLPHKGTSDTHRNSHMYWLNLNSLPSVDNDPRVITLRADTISITVYHIDSVQVNHTSQNVSHLTMEKPNWLR
ncbi:RES family NAD+ phosphorylase [Aeromonas veronii]|uniref:RES family NAD+ phosphorylase n=1 Tax=Aeromonas veronii TaxID=654 RepID=UPI003F7466A8